MFKKSVSLLLVLMMVIGSLAGCSSPAEEPAPATDNTTEAPAEDTTSEAPAEEPMAVEQVLYWNIGSEPKTIDPGLNAASDGGDVINNMFEGLVREWNGKIEPGMAESWTVSEDQTVYTFTIRDAKWSDGQAITANDFEYAWNRVLDPETAF